MAVTNLRVMCKIIPFTYVRTYVQMTILIFLEIVETAAQLLLQVWTLCVAGYAQDAIVGACHRTSDGQEHKIIWRAGPERDTIFHLPVTACREQGSHCRDERLAGVAPQWQGTYFSSSFVSKVLGANCRRANNFNPVADKFAM